MSETKTAPAVTPPVQTVTLGNVSAVTAWSGATGPGVVAQPATGPARRKVAIVGKAKSSVHLAPYGDESWEIWGLSDLCFSIPRWTRWFELHDIEAGKKRWEAKYIDWLKNCNGPLLTHRAYHDVPAGEPFPFHRLIARFGRYFNNSISWMIAYAIEVYGLGPGDELALWGVDMAVSDPAKGNNGEYEHQRPSCEYFLGLARGLGIKVTVPEESDLLKTHKLYALETHTGDAWVKLKTRQRELKQRLAEAEQRQEQAAQELLILRGALEDLGYCMRWV